MARQAVKGLIPHEFTRVRIGGALYEFRTLSIGQVAVGQQALKTLLHKLLPIQAKAAADITPEDDASITPALRDIFAIVCPELSQINEQCGAPGCDNAEPHPDYHHLNDNPKAIQALIAFYVRQDWGKLRQMMEAGESRETEATPQEARETFTIVCKVVATFWNISTLDFFDLRFEEAADLIIQANKSWDEGNGGKMRVEQFLTHAQHMVGDIGECASPDFAPGFMDQFKRVN